MACQAIDERSTNTPINMSPSPIVTSDLELRSVSWQGCTGEQSLTGHTPSGRQAIGHIAGYHGISGTVPSIRCWLSHRSPLSKPTHPSCEPATKTALDDLPSSAFGTVTRSDMSARKRDGWTSPQRLRRNKNAVLIPAVERLRSPRPTIRALNIYNMVCLSRV